VDFEKLFVLFKNKNPKGSQSFCFQEESEATEGYEYSLFFRIPKMICLIFDLLFIKEKCHKLFGLFASLISQMKDVIALGQ